MTKRAEAASFQRDTLRAPRYKILTLQVPDHAGKLVKWGLYPMAKQLVDLLIFLA